MPKKTKKNKNALPNRGNEQHVINPRENVVIYRGPVSPPGANQERAMITTFMSAGTALLTSSAGGVINLVASNDPSVYNDWSSLQPIWDEYRVLGFKWIFMPYNKYNRPSTTVVGPVYIVVDRDDATALTTEALAMNFESVKQKYLGDRITMEAKMAGLNDGKFITTASPVATCWIKMYSAGLTASTDYGKYTMQALVQFRGRN